jgi:uncharacterized membrane protein
MDHVAQGFEGLGALVLIVGSLWSLAIGGVAWRRSGNPGMAYAQVRQTLGGSLLLGLEILVAADLVRTIAVAPTVENVLILGLIVLIRTFLSFSLEIEMTGVAPWHRAPARTSGAVPQKQATARPRAEDHSGRQLRNGLIVPRDPGHRGLSSGNAPSGTPTAGRRDARHGCGA